MVCNKFTLTAEFVMLITGTSIGLWLWHCLGKPMTDHESHKMGCYSLLKDW
jgi:hypothetical protein